MSKRFPITTPVADLPYYAVTKPLFSVGNLVRLCKEEGVGQSPWRATKKAGLILETSWAVVDWHTRNDHGEEPFCAVECRILWNDGDTSYTAQACLEMIDESR